MKYRVCLVIFVIMVVLRGNPCSAQVSSHNMEKVATISGLFPFSVCGKYGYKFQYLDPGYRLIIYDLSNPTAPARRGSVDIIDEYDDDLKLRDWAISGNRLYLLTHLRICPDDDPQDVSALSIVDIKNPDHPVLLLNSSREFMEDTESLSVSDNLAVITGEDTYGNNEGIWIYDVSNPRKPVKKAAFKDGPFSSNGITLNRKTLYVTDSEKAKGIGIYDLSNPKKPQYKGGIRLSNSYNAWVTTGDEESLFVWASADDDSSDTLSVYDVHNPKKPKRIGALPLNDTDWVDWSDNIAYVYDMNMISAIDISNPASPKLNGWYAMNDDCYFLSIVSDNYVYFWRWDAAENYTLQIFRYSPPIRVSGINRDGYKAGLLAEGKKVYTDRATTFAAPIPQALSGQTFLQTRNGDASKNGNTFLRFTVDRPTTAYVGIDARFTTPPAWLKTWKIDPDFLSVSDSQSSQRILFKKHFASGRVELGGNADQSRPSGCAMYSVVLVPD